MWVQYWRDQAPQPMSNVPLSHVTDAIYNERQETAFRNVKRKMADLIECIPNFSEARRPDVIDKIVAAIVSVEGAQLLDRSSDLDHNRTVLTYAGPAGAVEEAAFRAIKTAAELIDLNQHTGEHPRIGATDVVPFVPLSGASIEDCIAIAQRVGERVGRELQIPVYLYEFASSRPERANLENLRRGQFEGLKADIQDNPERAPDFGPAKLGTAGATVIGARNPLIAFNVHLTTADTGVAKRIAKAVRQSSGGLRFVKALGLLVEGRAQVSINLTNYRESPIGRVLELIRREAARYGAAIHHSELVGLIPQEALVDAAVWYTQLDRFSPDQILESRLVQTGLSPARALSHTPSGSSYLAEVAAATAAPGGGSAAAYAGALGAALTEMVAGLTVGKEKYSGVKAEMLAVRLHAEKLRAELSQAVEEDSAAFEAVMGAYNLPKGTPPEQRARRAAIQVAMLNASHVPLHTATSAVQTMELAAQCVRDGNINAISDAASAAALGHAALVAAGYNVRLNLASVEDKGTTGKLLKQLRDLEARASVIDEEIRRTLEARANISW
jgi:glutamate formiminotransferase/formiminotetrahydrofolate cyclodeaminase